MQLNWIDISVFIVFSIISAIISTEHFVGISGQEAGNVGLVVSGYQLPGDVTIVFIAIFFFSRFFRSGISTLPEFLESRYISTASGLMAFYRMAVFTWKNPLPRAVAMPINKDYDMRPAPSVIWLVSLIILGVVCFYIVFW